MFGAIPRPLALLLALVLATRIAAVLLAGPPSLEKDAGHYNDLATNVAEGNGFAFSAEMQYPWQRDAAGTPQPTARRPVLFPLLLGGLYAAGLGPTAMVWIHAFLAPVTAAALYALARRVGLGASGGLWAVGLYLLYPPFTLYTTQLLTESFYLAFLAVGAWLVLRAADSRSLAGSFVAGAILGAATLLRPTSLLLPAALLPFLWRRPGGRAAWGALALGFALTMAPWVARNAVVFGHFEPTFTSSGYNLFMGTYPPTRGASNMPESGQPPELVASLRGKDEFAINRLYREAAVRNVKEHPGEVAKLVLAKAILCWFQTEPQKNMFLPTPRSFALNAPLLILGIAGFTLLVRRGAPHAWLPLLMIAYFVVMHLASVATVRYNLPSVPFLLVGVAAALEAWTGRRTGRGTPDSPRAA